MTKSVRTVTAHICCSLKKALAKAGFVQVETTPGPADGSIQALGSNSRNCPSCGAPPREHELRDFNEIIREGDIYCTRCGEFVRPFNP